MIIIIIIGLFNECIYNIKQNDHLELFLIFSCLILLKAMNLSRKALLKNGTFSASTVVNTCNLSYPVG